MIDLAALAKRAGGSFDGRNALLPGPGHSAADRSLSVSIGDNGKLIWWSFAGDDAAGVRAHLKSLGIDVMAVRAIARTPSTAETAEEPTAMARLAAALWRQSAPIEGTLAALYLERRSVAGPWPAALRFHPSCADGPFRRPALIAARTLLDAPSQVLSIQRTYLRRDDVGKANIASVKRSLGRCKSGGVVLGEIGDALVVAEGVETALSAAAYFAMPAVATLGTAFTRGLIVPERVRRVLIATDNDEPGLRAAHTLATRLRGQGREVRIETPPPTFKDFNDLATGKERGVGAPRPCRGGGPPHGV